MNRVIMLSSLAFSHKKSGVSQVHQNDLLFNKIQYTADEVISKARTDLKEWLDFTVKCNYDAAHHEGPHDSGMGWLIRNKHGTLLEAGMRKFEGRSTVMESELSALIWSMQACSSLGYRSVIFEGDNLSILKYIKGEAYSSRCQQLVNSVIAWKSRFLSTSYVHVHRQHNGCADLLAKKSIISPTDWSLFQSCRGFLYNNICTDNN
ncbi:hypothetical protein Bca4012_004979 [Brassica carinata]